MSKITASDLAWEKYGQSNPYFGVFTDEIFKTSNLTDDILKTFFESGKEHVNHLMNVLNWLAKEQPKFKTILDFGCGTGRLVIPFSAIAERVVGIDVSPSMLNEAEKNLKRLGIDNVNLIQSNSLESLEGKKFDLVHTFIVLQHIPVSSGYGLIKSLLDVINPGGYAMIHLTYSNDKSAFKNIKYHLRSRYKLFAQFYNLIKGKNPNAPSMQMNNYSLNHIFRMIDKAGINSFYSELTNHAGFRGVNLYLRKEQS
ncbi:MAG: class I SAM-dependent methyltransferase [Ferruginibacter sp.]